MIELKIKDLTDKQQAEFVLGYANKNFFDEAVKESGLDVVNYAMFKKGLLIEDPEITEKEIEVAISGATSDTVSKYVNLAVKNTYNHIQVMSAPGDDGKEVFFAALAHFDKATDPVDAIVELAETFSKNKIQGTDIEMKDIPIVVLETTPDGKFIPKPISIGDVKSE